MTTVIPDELCCAQVHKDSADGNAYKLTAHELDAIEFPCRIVATLSRDRCWAIESAKGRCEQVPIAVIIAGQDRVALCPWDLREHLEGMTLWVAPPPATAKTSTGSPA